MLTARSAETFTLVLATAAPASELRAWLASAAPGDRAVYAVGVDLPREAEGVLLARQWAGEGLVHLFRERDGGRTRFLVEKARRADEPATPAPARVSPCSRPGATEHEAARLLAHLRALAEAGAPCPSNAALARAIGLARGKPGRDRAQYLITRLVRDRRIAVQGRGTCAPRVVTLLEAADAVP